MNLHLIVQISFVVLTAICLLAIHYGLKVGLRNFPPQRQASILKKFWIFISLWLVIISIASLSGFTSDFDSLPPRPALFIIIPAVILVFLLRSSDTNQILQDTPPKYLLYIQMFRIPVEILLWMLLLAGITPIQMTFEGRNFDILVGITAPIIAYSAFAKGRFKHRMAIIWNVFGLLLLLNILVIAVLSMPTPLRVFMNEPANTEVGKFPIILLPAVLVPIAYYFHIFSIKQLLLKRQ